MAERRDTIALVATRFARYHKVAALTDEPTPLRRLIAALTAGGLAFLLTQFLLGVVWGAGMIVAPLSAFALAIAAAFAAATTRRVMAVTYGVLGAIWLLLEGLVLALGCFLATLG